MKEHPLYKFYDLTIPILLAPLGGEKKLRLQTAKFIKIKEKERILEIGCGSASLLKIIQKLNPNTELYGFDGSKVMLKKAKSKVKAKFKLGAIEKINYPKNYFDKIYTSFFLHELTLKQRNHLLKKIKGYLKPKGYFIIADYPNPNNKKALKFGSIIEPEHKENLKNQKTLLKELEKNFKIIKKGKILKNFGFILALQKA